MTPATPHLVVDLDVLQRNIATMADRARELGVALRPHVKTHKVPQIGAMQRAAGAQGITVATVGEAEVFAHAGFDDIFIAYPLWIDAERAARLAGLSERAAIRIGCDSVESARNASRHLGSTAAGRIGVVIEVNSGHHRSGGRPDEAGEVAAAVEHLGFRIDGVFTFPGHSYGPDARSSAAEAERDALSRGAASLARAGLSAAVRSGGSSPSMAFALGDRSDAGITEMRPGAYVFNDAQQWELGACAPEDIALTARATVISHAGGRLVLDSGSKVLAPDKAAWVSGFGRLLDFPKARIVQLSEHHAVVDMAGEPLPSLGSQVRVVPNHCCNAVNLADVLRVESGGELVDEWLVAARGRND